jgi:hypothetical protein
MIKIEFQRVINHSSEESKCGNEVNCGMHYSPLRLYSSMLMLKLPVTQDLFTNGIYKLNKITIILLFKSSYWNNIEVSACCR